VGGERFRQLFILFGWMTFGTNSVGFAAILSFLLGTATVFSFAPFYLSWLPILTLAGLIWLWHAFPGRGRSALLGFAFGFGLFCGGVNWIYVSLHDFGGMPAALAVFCTVLLSLILAAYPTLVGLFQAWFAAPRWPQQVLLIPALWTLFEWIRGWMFTGFPWLSLGYAQAADGPLAGFAPLVGVYGVSLLTVMASGLIVLAGFALAARRFSSALVLGITLALIIASGVALTHYEWTKPTSAAISVSLVQGNITQDIKWKSETLDSTLTTYRDLTLASKSKLIILPETAFPVFLAQLPEEYLAEFDAHAKKLGGDLLIGVPETTGPTTYHNSVVSFGVSPHQTYRKSHLVPFSEFIPFKWLIGWVYDDLLDMPLADFTAGEIDQASFAVAGQKIAMTNCYEDLFGEEIIRRLPEATMLANVSNDAWFGQSWGPQQHLQISQMRALEMGRYMLRATNTGVTAIIDQKGRVVSRAPEFTRMSLDGMAQGFSGHTPYIRFGNLGGISLSVLMLAIALALRSRQPASDNP
jgi:apolipoprotein N-acyltransferase